MLPLPAAGGRIWGPCPGPPGPGGGGGGGAPLAPPFLAPPLPSEAAGELKTPEPQLLFSTPFPAGAALLKELTSLYMKSYETSTA